MIALLAEELEALQIDIEGGGLDAGELVCAYNSYLELRERLALMRCRPSPNKGVEFVLIPLDIVFYE